ncbi:receptor kinase-like protein Xa21 [Bidens hawaiensis]|uniref:receptor kinase-like protein Xa21 n=1 Tax=Bidens hawaiensis TaxID=980011 RepID=UPI004049BBB9
MLFTSLCKEAVLVLALLIQTNAVVSSSNFSTDHLALLAIKSKITYDPQQVFNSWNDSLPFCQWQGVTCGRRHQRVTILNLTDKGLVGSISPYLGNLSFIRYILIGYNQLHGSIPPDIGRLSRLQVLFLRKNSLTGEIPENISSCSRLSVVNLAINMLYGKIPIFSSLSMMKSLVLRKNNFTGGIPPSIGNLTSLERLYLSESPLGGSIPDSFYRLKNLRELVLADSGLVGAYPMFLFNLTMLELLNFPFNQLHGSLPSNLCLAQPLLRTLELADNHFNGILPPSISNCSKLESLDVSNNSFMGKITTDFGRLQYLWSLILALNNLGSKDLDGMNFFHSLSNCSNLELLEFSSIQLGGVLPNSLGNFSSKLGYLGLEATYISGHVPSSIGNLFGLSTLNLRSNYFTGMIPESIGKLQGLGNLYLGYNEFSGIIPRSIGNLSFVTKLELCENSLEGTIPSTFGVSKWLIFLDLHRNNLSGSVPKELFKLSSLSIILDLSQNNLSGVLPQEIGNLKLLGSLDLSKNHFSGEIPSGLGSCISLQNLNLSGNLFYGSVSEAFTSLKGLEYVDLSRNNFSGHIPTNLQQLLLTYLDISYNNFEGDVPVKGVFSNTSAISIIGNTRLCGGIPELHLPRCTSTTSNSERRTRKLYVRAIVAISLCSVVAGLSMLAFILLYCCIKRKRDKPSESTLAECFEKISYGKLFKATEGFSSKNLIGTGSFASVYKGVIDENGFIVAIKVLNLLHRGGSKSFMAECEALRNIRHRNLLKVITSCSSIDFQGNDFKALVYEFMPNGSLESCLYSIDHKLDLVQRINIIKDVACALDYLHRGCGNVIVHCDLKPSNILLDADMVAHVGDFGLAKILSFEEGSNANTSSSSIIRGTTGYAAPEYGLGNEVSTSGDMYSFGILLLEMLTGKKPTDPMFEGGLGLHSYAMSALADGSVLQILDPMLLIEDVYEYGLISLVKIGVQCSYESPQDRMDIGTTVHKLFAITIQLGLDSLNSYNVGGAYQKS